MLYFLVTQDSIPDSPDSRNGSFFRDWLRGDGYRALGLTEKQFLIANLESWATNSISNLTSYIDVKLSLLKLEPTAKYILSENLV